MEITKHTEGNTTTLTLKGRLDTVTSTQLSDELNLVFENGGSNLIFDFHSLVYISSAGLRVLLTAQKKVKSYGMEMEIVGANETVKEVFEITGFSGIFNIV